LEEHAGELTAAKKHLIEDQNERRKESIKGFVLGKNS
ncbi:spore protein, partial [Desulfosporosinus sp. HMP52]